MYKKLALAVLLTISASSAPAAWTGLYAGADVVYGSGDAKSSVTGSPTIFPAFPLWAPIEANNASGNLNTHTNGATLAGHIGYAWQRNAIVYGVEADLQGQGMRGSSNFANKDPSFAAVGEDFTSTVTQTNRIDYLGTIRGRIGYASGESWMVYGTGGLAYGSLHSTVQLSERFTPALAVTFPASRNPGDSTTFRAGWALGGGAEYAVNKQWAVRTEYLYYDLGRTHTGFDSSIVGATPQSRVQFDSSTKWSGSLVRVGLSYRF